jgi:hypothetical protein
MGKLASVGTGSFDVFAQMPKLNWEVLGVPFL